MGVMNKRLKKKQVQSVVLETLFQTRTKGPQATKTERYFRIFQFLIKGDDRFWTLEGNI